MPENKLLKAAIWYREKMSFSVIPLAPGQKFPPKGFEVIPYRTERASVEQIREWWGKNPNYNIGIITGRISNLFVVDHDKYKPTYNPEKALELIPDNIITPTSSSPSGGDHQYFLYEGADDTSIGTCEQIAMDYRGETGYIVAPPSLNGTGIPYSWKQGLEIHKTALSPVPISFISYLKIMLKTNNIYRGSQKVDGQCVTNETKRDIWAEGCRDENLFHVANCLVKTANSPEYIRQLLRAIVSSWGEQDEAWINAKIKSAYDRAERKERNIQAEVDAFISVTEGNFSVTSCYKELGFVTSRDMVAARKAISRRKGLTIEKSGDKDGWYRRIDTDIEYLDFKEEEGEPSVLKLPFGLHELVDIYQGNIILCSGEFNSGKSLFALSTLVDNRNRFNIRYASSEMKVREIKGRFKWFGIDKEVWMPDESLKYIALKNNLTNAMDPDGLNIIDYLEFPEGDYTRAAEYMRQIHDKLQKGIAIVCVQHKVGARLPRSGDLILEKPRLAISLKKIEGSHEDVVGVAEIIKCKHPKIGKMDGKRLKYEIRNNGSMFNTLIDWGFWRM
jgi:hypothetical protein